MGGACNKLTQEGDGAALPKLTCQAVFCFWGDGFQTEAIITGPVLHYIRMLVLDAEWADILLILHEKKNDLSKHIWVKQNILQSPTKPSLEVTFSRFVVTT